MWQLITLSAMVSIASGLLLVPLIRCVFLRFGFIDKPDAVRKLQKNAVSLGGGLAVFVTVCLTFAVTLLADRYLGEGLLGTLSTRWHVLFYAAGGLMLVGLVDDLFTLRGRQKLLLQILIVSAVVGGGTVVQRVAVFGHGFDLGVFAFPLTVIWLLAAINALNLIDGADGMASTVGAIISAGLAAVCLQTGSQLGAIVGCALAGSLLAFLCFNRPPATIYLGDAGSMVIGLFIGVISIWGSVKGSTLLSVAPMLVLSLPLFDSVIAILRRVLTGRSIYTTDRGHLHHRLLDRFSHPVMLLVVAVLTLATSVAGVLSVVLQQQWIAFAGVAFVLAALVLSKTFGSAEIGMLVKRLGHFAESMLMRSNQSNKQVHQKTIQLQGCRKWDAIWSSLVEFAVDHDLSKVKLDLSIAWMQEGYHGTWQRARMPDKSEQFLVKLPIHLDGKLVGRLEVIGNSNSDSLVATFEQLQERFSELLVQVEALFAAVSPSPPMSSGNVLAPRIQLPSQDLHGEPISVSKESQANPAPDSAELLIGSRAVLQ